MFKNYSLRKSRHILKSSSKTYQKKGNSLSSHELHQFEDLLQKLDDAILKQNKEEANLYAHQVEDFTKGHFKKSVWNYLIELATAIVIALAVATVVRQTWFELYEIPTGSMRPTFKEQDHLTVTKTAFGINVPLKTEHFYFDPHLVQRLSVVIWSGDQIPYLDSDSTFMGIFPYTKRYIKRCMGKPGDTLYFYGGQVYGLDEQGNDLEELRNNPWLTHLDHVPFTNFEGRVSYSSGGLPEAVFYHFNQPIGRLRFLSQGMKGEIFNGKQWMTDQPAAQDKSHSELKTYSDFFGIRNFAMTRLLNKKELESYTSFKSDEMEEGILYMEFRHTPSLTYPEPFVSERQGVTLKGFSTVIPLQEKHLKALMDNLYTCRFVVKNGRGASYRIGGEKINQNSPQFKGIPDGTYEFYYGKGWKIGWGGVATALPKDHPLYHVSPENIQRLFNIGIEMTKYVEPHSRNQPYFPNRYSYFRNGALYSMGGIIMEKEDSLLKSFHEREKKREEMATPKTPYVAFKDYGPPLTEAGELDKEFLKTFGLKIPEKHYLMLGDNHAMSQDSRYFGPIPQTNLQGAPSLILWPPGERWGVPNQKPYPLLVLPRLIIWGIAGLILLLWYLYHLRSLKKPIFKKLK